jgi:hypothetical protein
MATKTYSERTGLRNQPSWLRAWLIAGSLSLLVCAHLGAASNALAQDSPSEYQVKAAYLFNFLKFVEWPEGAFPDPLAPIVIGIVGDDPFGEALPQVVIGKTAQGRDLAIQNTALARICAQATSFLSVPQRRRGFHNSWPVCMDQTC